MDSGLSRLVCWAWGHELKPGPFDGRQIVCRREGRILAYAEEYEALPEWLTRHIVFRGFRSAFTRGWLRRGLEALACVVFGHSDVRFDEWERDLWRWQCSRCRTPNGPWRVAEGDCDG